MHQPGARRVQQPDPTPGRADQRGHRAADAVEHGGDVEAGGDELAGREQRGQLLGAAAALVEQAALLDGRGQRTRQLGGDLDVGVVEGATLPRGQRDGAEDAVAVDQRHQECGAIPALGEQAPAHLGHRGGADVVHPDRLGAGDELGQERVVQRHADIPGRHTRRRSAQDVEHLELAALAVEQRHRQCVEADQAGEPVGKPAEHVVQRIAGDEQPGNLVEDGHAQGPLLQPPHGLDGRSQLAAELRRDREAAEAPRGPDQHEPAHRPARRTQGDAANHCAGRGSRAAGRGSGPARASTRRRRPGATWR